MATTSATAAKKADDTKASPEAALPTVDGKVQAPEANQLILDEGNRPVLDQIAQDYRKSVEDSTK